MSTREVDSRRRVPERLVEDPRRAKVIFLGKGSLPERDHNLARKLALLQRHLSPTVIGARSSRAPNVPGVRVVAFPDPRPAFLGGLLFYAAGPVVAVRRGVRERASAIVCQSPLEGVGTIALTRLLPARTRPRVVIEAHGDWKAATRLYGSSLRGVLSPIADSLARWALRRADLVRTVSDEVEGSVRAAGYRGPFLRYSTYSDYREFTESPLVDIPADPQIAFIGGLAPTKGVDVLLDAWSAVTKARPEARLVLAGDGPSRSALEAAAAELGIASTLRFAGHLSRKEARELLDASWCLVLPSRTEGMPRVIPEAFARGRAVVASAVGGIPAVVQEGVTGFLVPADDSGRLATALTSALEQPDRTRSMGEAAHAVFVSWDPEREYRDGLRQLGRWALSGDSPRRPRR